MSKPTLAEAVQALEFALKHDYPAPVSCRTILDDVYKRHPEFDPSIPARARPLGSTQRQVLCSLVRTGYWCTSITCGWTWDNDSGTTKIMNGLVKRGLATLTGGRYEPTDEGIAVAGHIEAGKRGAL